MSIVKLEELVARVRQMPPLTEAPRSLARRIVEDGVLSKALQDMVDGKSTNRAHALMAYIKTIQEIDRQKFTRQGQFWGGVLSDFKKLSKLLSGVA